MNGSVVYVPVCIGVWSPKRTIRGLPLKFPISFPWEGGFLLNLEQDWKLVNPGYPPDSVYHNTGLTGTYAMPDFLQECLKSELGYCKQGLLSSEPSLQPLYYFLKHAMSLMLCTLLFLYSKWNKYFVVFCDLCSTVFLFWFRGLLHFLCEETVCECYRYLMNFIKYRWFPVMQNYT